MEAVSYLDRVLGILALLILLAGIWMLVSGVGDLNR
jgi:hypothetical protein